MNTLIATVGLPRSGKSTWSKMKSKLNGWPIVNPDSVRLAIHGERYLASAEPFVWATTKAMVQSLFLAGHDTVILDATNIRKNIRDNWVSIGGEGKTSNLFPYAVRFYHVPTSKETCIARALGMNDSYIIPVIEKMAAEYEPLDVTEIRYHDDWRLDYVR